VAISAAKHCIYCEAAHLAFCRILKVDTETCKNLAGNLDSIRPERTRDIVKFGLKTGTNPQSIDDADYKILKGHGIDEAGIIEIVAMSGFAVNAITIADALKLDVDKWD
jgi:alkylhydroperoxidase family enzyme